ncbi:hypothetical protein [Streptomyces sp. NPDC055287]
MLQDLSARSADEPSHPKAALFLHSNGLAEHLLPNSVAWTLACAWSGQRLNRPLTSPTLITGTDDSTRTFTRLPEALATQTT